MKNILKILKFIIINLLIIVILVYTFNFICFLKKNADYHQVSFLQLRHYHSDELFKLTFRLKSFDEFYNEKKDQLFRPIEGKEYTEKKPLIFMGCSFSYGHILPDDKIISARISQKAKMKVYNFGYPGWGVQQILYLFQHNDTLKNIEKVGTGKQYIIYWYIEDHLRRMYHQLDPGSIYYFIIYKEKDGDLYPLTKFHPYLDAIIVYRDYQYEKMIDKFNQLSEEEKYRFFNLHIKKIMEEKQKLFPDAEFIIMSSSDHFPDEEAETLKKIGIRVLYTKDLTGVDMENDPDWTYDIHPNAAAVEKLSDALIKELNL